ncbi:DciA family protein [Telmatospirillum sp.]|uniref:DUF721 domain-containing protein n=1 Tax=Telmatospirillum sp. TaxID=2079197 RepID=UPI00284D85DF|nr:DciA family protein [Telmatospirillum sp.]MDR3435959.1 DciA family protein [Telmatospirillum sp.]
MPDQPEEKRGSAGPRAIAETAARLTRRTLGKHGFTEAAMVTEWPIIVGSLLGEASMPLRIRFPRGERSGGTLAIRVASGAMATQIQHQEPLLIQRINGYFGYAAVARLSITQGPVPRQPRHRPPAVPQLTGEQEQDLATQLRDVEDPELKSVLAALGRHLAARR